MSHRYQTVPQTTLYAVIDVWTGMSVVIAEVEQVDLSKDEADGLAQMLNERAAKGIREILQ